MTLQQHTEMWQSTRPIAIGNGLQNIVILYLNVLLN
jgi:hypothetical protein